MYGGASDDELADICDDAEFKKNSAWPRRRR